MKSEDLSTTARMDFPLKLSKEDMTLMLKELRLAGGKYFWANQPALSDNTIGRMYIRPPDGPHSTRQTSVSYVFDGECWVRQTQNA